MFKGCLYGRVVWGLGGDFWGGGENWKRDEGGGGVRRGRSFVYLLERGVLEAEVVWLARLGCLGMV